MCSVPSGPFSRHVRYGLRAGLGWAQKCCSSDLHQERSSRTRGADPSARSWLASLSVFLSPHPRPPRREAVRVRGRRRVLAAHERWQCWHPPGRCTLHYVPTQLQPSRRWPAELKDGAGWRTDHQGPSPAQAQARLKGKRNTRTQNPHRPNAPGEARTSTMPIAARRACSTARTLASRRHVSPITQRSRSALLDSCAGAATLAMLQTICGRTDCGEILPKSLRTRSSKHV